MKRLGELLYFQLFSSLIHHFCNTTKYVMKSLKRVIRAISRRRREKLAKFPVSVATKSLFNSVVKKHRIAVRIN